MQEAFHLPARRNKGQPALVRRVGDARIGNAGFVQPLAHAGNSLVGRREGLSDLLWRPTLAVVGGAWVRHIHQILVRLVEVALLQPHAHDVLGVRLHATQIYLWNRVSRGRHGRRAPEQQSSRRPGRRARLR